jgi:hypothetical protein
MMRLHQDPSLDSPLEVDVQAQRHRRTRLGPTYIDIDKYLDLHQHHHYDYHHYHPRHDHIVHARYIRIDITDIVETHMSFVAILAP